MVAIFRKFSSRSDNILGNWISGGHVVFLVVYTIDVTIGFIYAYTCVCMCLAYTVLTVGEKGIII